MHLFPLGSTLRRSTGLRAWPVAALPSDLPRITVRLRKKKEKQKKVNPTPAPLAPPHEAEVATARSCVARRCSTAALAAHCTLVAGHSTRCRSSPHTMLWLPLAPSQLFPSPVAASPYAGRSFHARRSQLRQAPFAVSSHAGRWSKLSPSLVAVFCPGARWSVPAPPSTVAAFVIAGRSFFRRRLQLSPSPVETRRVRHPSIPPCRLQLVVAPVSVIRDAGRSKPRRRFQHTAAPLPAPRFAGRSAPWRGSLASTAAPHRSTSPMSPPHSPRTR